jgi:cysteinyl-tRNA synthetase
MDGGEVRKSYAREDDGGEHQVDADKVSFLLMDREQARLDRDFRTADSIREQLEEMVGPAIMTHHIVSQPAGVLCV